MDNKKFLLFLVIFIISITAVSAANVTDTSVNSTVQSNSNSITTNTDYQSVSTEDNEIATNNSIKENTNNKIEENQKISDNKIKTNNSIKENTNNKVEETQKISDNKIKTTTTANNTVVSTENSNSTINQKNYGNQVVADSNNNLNTTSDNSNSTYLVQNGYTKINNNTDVVPVIIRDNNSTLVPSITPEQADKLASPALYPVNVTTVSNQTFASTKLYYEYGYLFYEVTNSDNVSFVDIDAYTGDNLGGAGNEIPLNFTDNQSSNKALENPTSNLNITVMNNSSIKTLNLTNSNIPKEDIIINVNNVTAHSGEHIEINANVTTVSGVNLNNAKAVAKINGKTIAHSVVTNGTVAFNYTLPVWQAKNYTITVKVGDTSTTNYNQQNSTLSIYRLATIITIDNVTYAQRGQYTNITAHFTDNLTNIINHGKVAFKINGKTIGETKVLNGTATVSYKAPITVGIYNITIKYGANTLYKSAIANSKLSVISENVTSFTNEQIYEAANRVKNYKINHNELPTWVVINNHNIAMSDFLYLMCQSLNTNNSIVQGYFKTPNVSSENITNGNIYKTEYLQISQTIIKYMESTQIGPEYTNTSLGALNFNSTVDAFSRILAYQYNNNRLPNYVSIKQTNTTKNNTTDLSQYLQPTKNCQSNDSRIIALSQNLTAGQKTTWDKATAIFNYVRDNIKYLDQANTKYGAVGAYTNKIGTCCDMNHLLIALLRASNIPAKYMQGQCKFIYTNRTLSTIWTNAYIDGQWITANPTSHRNTLNNTKNCIQIGPAKEYISLPF